MSIKENILKLKAEIPSDVTILVATKKRTVEEIEEAIKEGMTIIGENYIQEAEEKYRVLKDKVKFHCIGHLQTNKVKKAVEMFDMIQTVDSVRISSEIDKQCKKIDKIMPVLIEVNIAKEPNKYGCMVEEVFELAEHISSLENVDLKGLMTMGPNVPAEELRSYFKSMKELFDKLKEKYQINVLSMGMTDSYKVAIEEGATIVRLGTVIFGKK